MAEWNDSWFLSLDSCNEFDLEKGQAHSIFFFYSVESIQCFCILDRLWSNWSLHMDSIETTICIRFILLLLYSNFSALNLQTLISNTTNIKTIKKTTESKGGKTWFSVLHILIGTAISAETFFRPLKIPFNHRSIHMISFDSI